MNEHVYITETGEWVRERDGHVEVGLSPEARAALGTLLHFEPLKIGKRVKSGDQLFVVEGMLSAAEFYAPVCGQVIPRASSHSSTSGGLVILKKSHD